MSIPMSLSLSLIRTKSLKSFQANNLSLGLRFKSQILLRNLALGSGKMVSLFTQVVVITSKLPLVMYFQAILSSMLFTEIGIVIILAICSPIIYYADFANPTFSISN